jgi:hypothetical protein
MARSGDADLAMELFPHSFVDLEEIPLITPKLTLIIPRRGVRFTFRQIGLKELSQQPMVLLQPVTTKSSDRRSIPEKQPQDAR